MLDAILEIIANGIIGIFSTKKCSPKAEETHPLTEETENHNK